MAWLDYKELLTHNAMLYYIVSTRGWGKTYGWKHEAVERWLRFKTQFMYTRRYNSEFDDNKTFFKSLMRHNAFPNHKLEVSGNEYAIDGKCAGYSQALSTAQGKKSTEFPDVDFGCTDEFLLEPGSSAYLKGEVNIALGLIETVDRERDKIIWFFLGNNITKSNPYFAFHNADPPDNGIWKDETKLVMISTRTDADFIQQQQSKRLGRITQGKAFSDYAYGNKSLLDNDKFIDRKHDNPRYWFTVVYDGYQFGVWEARDYSRVWVSYDVDPMAHARYTFSTSEHSENTRLIKKAARNSMWAQFVKDYAEGFVYFEHVNIKNVILQIVNKSYI